MVTSNAVSPYPEWMISSAEWCALPNAPVGAADHRPSSPREDVRVAWENLLGLAAAVTTPADLRVAKTDVARANLVLDRAHTIAMMTGSVPWVKNSNAHDRVKTLLDRITKINRGARALLFQEYNAAHDVQKLPISKEDSDAIPKSESERKALLSASRGFQDLRQVNAPWSALLEYVAGNEFTRRATYQQTLVRARYRDTNRLLRKVTIAGSVVLVACTLGPFLLNATTVPLYLWRAFRTVGGLSTAAKVFPSVVKGAGHLDLIETSAALGTIPLIFGSTLSDAAYHGLAMSALPMLWPTPSGEWLDQVQQLAENNPLSQLLHEKSGKGSVSPAAHAMLAALPMADGYLIGHLSIPEIEAFAVGSDAERTRILYENPPSMKAELLAIRARLRHDAPDSTAMLLPPSARPAPLARWKLVVDIMKGLMEGIKLVYPNLWFTPSPGNQKLARRIAHFRNVLPSQWTPNAIESSDAMAMQQQAAMKIMESMPEFTQDDPSMWVTSKQEEDQMFANQAQRALTNGFKADRPRPMDALLAKLPQSVPPEPSLGRMLRAP